MKFNPKKLLKPRVIVWAATTLVLVGTLIAANAVAVGEYGSLIDSVLGGKKAITAPRDKSDPSYKTKQQAYDAGNAVTEKICDEGMILLKNENNALPLAKGAKVSVFGKNSTNYIRNQADGSKETVGIVTGGSGSAAPTDAERKTIYESLTDAGFSYNPKLKEFYESSASGRGRDSNPPMENGGVGPLATGETPYSDYTADIKASYDEYGDAALVVFSRIAGKSADAIDFEQSLKNAGFDVNPTALSFYKSTSSGSGRANGNDNWKGNSQVVIGETPIATVTGNADLMASLNEYNGAAVQVITREGSEGCDVKTCNAHDTKATNSSAEKISDRHALQLSENEEALFNELKNHTDNIIFVINSSNIFECDALEKDPKVAAILWVGNPGDVGAGAVGRRH